MGSSQMGGDQVITEADHGRLESLIAAAYERLAEPTGGWLDCIGGDELATAATDAISQWISERIDAARKAAYLEAAGLAAAGWHCSHIYKIMRGRAKELPAQRDPFAAAANAWISENGFDKHGVAAWLQARPS